MEAKVFVDWEEVFISNEKGRRVVHYYLKGADGGSDLAVVGKEKSLRHMSYAVPNHFFRSLRPCSSLKWRSRREVIDWLSSFVTYSLPCGSPRVDRFLDDEDPCTADVPLSKGLFSSKMKHRSKEFSWVGSSWTCRKRRKHYQAFCRNGITISVHDFVYVMAEENKRFVAYLEDLYEDLKANRMVVVRWFHKIDEVGIVLPPNFNDREIFFSLCLQDLDVECIDGLATILSPQHFEKFMNEATHTLWEPYMCHRQFNNDDIKPFDITQVKGYWNQELLRYMYTTSLNDSSKSISAYGFDVDNNASAIRSRLKRKQGWKSGDTDQHRKVGSTEKAVGIENSNRLTVNSGAARPVANGSTAICLTKKEVIKPRLLWELLSVGCHVEVLSQDSGIRGCWFRAVILKKHQFKVKVRYEDIQNADETGNLEEWVLASRVSDPDKLGVRLHGRTVVRPNPPIKGRVSSVFEVGTAVDAWWFDGWWEGIVIRRESEDNVHVYFPGEGRTSIFGHGDLRHSQDWVCSRWYHIQDRPDLVSSILSEQAGKSSDGSPLFQAEAAHRQPRNNAHVDSLVQENKAIRKSSPGLETPVERGKEAKVSNLTKDDSFVHLKWNSSKKRWRGRESLAKGRSDLKRLCDGNSSSREDGEFSACKRFLIPKPLKVDHEICKYGGDSLFTPSMPPLSNLVMSM